MLQTGFVPGSVARNRPELAWELLFAYGPRNDQTYGLTADSSHLVLLHFTIPLWVFCVYAVTQVTFPVSAMDIVCLLSLPRVAMSVRCRLSSVLSFLSRVSAFVGARGDCGSHTRSCLAEDTEREGTGIEPRVHRSFFPVNHTLPRPVLASVDIMQYSP
jgi:hypothetical protein